MSSASNSDEYWDNQDIFGDEGYVNDNEIINHFLADGFISDEMLEGFTSNYNERTRKCTIPGDFGDVLFSRVGRRRHFLPGSYFSDGSNFALKKMKLLSFDLPSTTTEIGDHIFASAKNLHTVELPPTLTSIGVGAFNDCISLQSINFPQSLKRIDNDAFGGCCSLVTVTIPSSLQFIGNGAFFRCTSLISIALPKEVVVLENSFSKCDCLINAVGCNESDEDIGIILVEWLKERFSDLPLHQACYESSISPSKIKEVIEVENFYNSSKLNLLKIDNMGMNALDVLVCNPKATLEHMQVILNTCPTLASMTTMKNECRVNVLSSKLRNKIPEIEDTISDDDLSDDVLSDKLSEDENTISSCTVNSEEILDLNRQIMTLQKPDQSHRQILMPVLQIAYNESQSLEYLHLLAMDSIDTLLSMKINPTSQVVSNKKQNELSNGQYSWTDTINHTQENFWKNRRMNISTRVSRKYQHISFYRYKIIDDTFKSTSGKHDVVILHHRGWHNINTLIKEEFEIGIDTLMQNTEKKLFEYKKEELLDLSLAEKVIWLRKVRVTRKMCQLRNEKQTLGERVFMWSWLNNR